VIEILWPTVTLNRMNAEDLHKTARIIGQQVKGYHDLCRYMFSAPSNQYSASGRYPVERILLELEQYVNYLEKVTPIIQQWTRVYLEENRGKLWLDTGLCQRVDAPHAELAKTWPFLYGQPRLDYKGFIIDREEARQEKERIEKRRDTPNPNYKPTLYNVHWFEDETDENQWYEEEREEERASKNLHVNYRIRDLLYEAMLPELEGLKDQWATWVPEKSLYWSRAADPSLPPIPSDLPPGKTRLEVAFKWLDSHFDYSIMYGFCTKDSNEEKEYDYLFNSTWSIAEHLDKIIANRREKLRMVREYLEKPDPPVHFQTQE